METCAKSVRPSSSKRQSEKIKQKEMKDKHFLINWLDEQDDDLYDVVPSKAVVPPDGINILDVDMGAICRVAFGGQYYRAKVIEIGTAAELRKKQKNLEQLSDGPGSVDSLEKDGSSVLNSKAVSSNLSTASSNLEGEDKAKCNQSDELVAEVTLTTAKKDGTAGCKNATSHSSTKDAPVKTKGRKTVNPFLLAESSEMQHSTPKVAMKPRRPANLSKEYLLDSEHHLEPQTTKPTNKLVDLVSNSELSGSDTSDDTSSTVLIKPKALLSHEKVLENVQKDWQRNNCLKVHSQHGSKRSRLPENVGEVSQKDFEDLQQKVASLEESIEKLTKKLKLQSQEIRFLKAIPQSSSRYSSRQVSRAGTPSLEELPTVEAESTDSDPNHTLISGIPVNKLKLQAAKLHTDAGKCALALMSCLFTAEELVNGNPAGISNSKDEARKKGIKQLDPNRMKFIQDYIESKWPGKYASLTKKITQKCTDMYKNRKELRHDS